MLLRPPSQLFHFPSTSLLAASSTASVAPQYENRSHKCPLCNEWINQEKQGGEKGDRSTLSGKVPARRPSNPLPARVYPRAVRKDTQKDFVPGVGTSTQRDDTLFPAQQGRDGSPPTRLPVEIQPRRHRHPRRVQDPPRERHAAPPLPDQMAHVRVHVERPVRRRHPPEPRPRQLLQEDRPVAPVARHVAFELLLRPERGRGGVLGDGRGANEQVLGQS